jgi:LysW-gamma-L-lysine carboxypeptidase
MAIDAQLWSSAALPTAAEHLLYELVSIPSPSGEEAEAAGYLVDWMARHGLDTELDEAGNAVGVKGDGKREIVLLGHIDTVPEIIAPRLEGRRLYGRGAVDAKGPLAAFAAAAARAKVPDGTCLIVIGATQEEVESSRGARHALLRCRPAACLVGEPSGWDRVTLGYKGRLSLEWRHSAAALHSAAPTPTPAELAVERWLTINRIFAPEGPRDAGHFQRTSVSLRALNTGRDNGASAAQMQVEFRLPPGVHPSEVEEKARAALPADHLRFSGHVPAFQAGKNTPVTRALIRSIRSSGGRPRFVHKTGTSDMNLVGPAWGCPIAAYGPGDSRLDHSPQEHIHLDEFVRAIDVISLALGDLMGEM